jgi:hypothetical protein
MISLMPGPVWQAFAQGPRGPLLAFALPLSLGELCRAGRFQRHSGLRKPDKYPSPSLRSGPSQAGPTSSVVGWAADWSWFRKRLEIRDVAVESGAITTTQRGSTTCGSRLSSSLFLPRPLPAACRILHRAGLPALLPAHWLPMRLTKTCWRVRPLAASPVLPPAGSSWACRPAIPATDQTACGRFNSNTGATRADRPGGPFLLRA